MCSKGLHRICPENAHVSELRLGFYRCHPCVLAFDRKRSKTSKRKAQRRRWDRHWNQSAKGNSYKRNYYKKPEWRAYYRTYFKQSRWRAYFRAWIKTPKGRATGKVAYHSRRARLKGNGGTWRPEQFAALCAKYKHRCLKCGKKRKLTPDHVRPICLGGRNTIGNLQPLCLPCNRIKHTSTTDYRKNPHPNCL
jgi:hypothetical protein